MARIPLRDRGGVIVAHALVDDDLFDELNVRRWCLTGNGGYAHRRIGVGRTESLGRRVLGLKYGDGFIADHINRNPLDNRRSNLRATTKSGNAQNSTAVRGRSGVRGVRWCTQTGKWKAAIQIDGKTVWGGRFDSVEEAAARRRELERIYHPLRPVA